MSARLPRRLKLPMSNRRLILLGIAIVIALYRFHFAPSTSPPSDAPTSGPSRGEEIQRPTDSATEAEPCADWPGCFTGVIAHIVDGDTLDVLSGSAKRRVRLVLVDAPERDTPQGPEATAHLTALCPVDSPATVRPDSNDPQDEYGRTLGVVYCGRQNANAEMIRSRRAEMYRRFCRRSVFGTADWARELGCAQ